MAPGRETSPVFLLEQARVAVLSACVLGVLAAVTGAAGAAEWSSPSLVGLDDWRDGSAPVIVAGDGDVAWIVWSGVDEDEGDSEIFFVEMNSQEQSPQALVHEPNGGMDRIPFASCGTDGVPWVIWERYGDGYSQVVSHWVGDHWAPPDTVFTQGGRYDWYGIYARNSADVWVCKSSVLPERQDRDIAVRHWDGQAWSVQEAVGLPGRDDVSPVMVVTESGEPHLVWLSETEMVLSGRNTIYASQRTSGEWGEPAVVDSAAGNSVLCDAAVCPDGRPIVVWVGNGYTSACDLEYAMLDGGVWSYGGQVNEADDPADDFDGQAMLSCRDGELWIVWYAVSAHAWRESIVAARWMGDAWSSEELVSAPDAGSLMPDNDPDIAVRNGGIVQAVWRRTDSDYPYDDDIQTAFRDVSTSADLWGLSASPMGDAVAVAWYSTSINGDSTFDVWRAYTAGAPVPENPPFDAERLTEEPVGDCVECRFEDGADLEEGVYAYWVERLGDGAMLGPVEVAVEGGPVPGDSMSLSILGNPAAGGVRLSVGGLMGRTASLSVYSAAGRLVRTFGVRDLASDGHTILWDGRDDSGAVVASGVYFCRAEASGCMVTSRVVLMQ